MSHFTPRLSGLRVVRENENSPYPKCSMSLRGMARLSDVVLAYMLNLAGGDAGATLALLYLLLADGLMNGQSLGKRLFGVRVVHIPSKTSGRYRESFLRNAPLGLVVLFGMMPSPLGKIASIAAAVLISGIEAWKVFSEPLGLRLGDVWAETQVVDGKVVAGSQQPVTSGEVPASGRLMSKAACE
jgi:uncharacterized RDD family membrane protein YckC